MKQIDDQKLLPSYHDTKSQTLNEKTNNIIYEILCLSVNILQVNKKEELIIEIQNTIKKLHELLEDLGN